MLTRGMNCSLGDHAGRDLGETIQKQDAKASPTTETDCDNGGGDPFEEKAALAYARLRQIARCAADTIQLACAATAELISSSRTTSACTPSRSGHSVHRSARSRPDLTAVRRDPVYEKMPASDRCAG